MSAKKKENLRISDQIKRDMLGYSYEIGQEILAFLKRLANNPNTVADPRPVEFSKDHFYHRLPSGCYVFWELLHTITAGPPSVLSQDGEIVRVTGVGFEFPKGFKEFDL